MCRPGWPRSATFSWPISSKFSAVSALAVDEASVVDRPRLDVPGNFTLHPRSSGVASQEVSEIDEGAGGFKRKGLTNGNDGRGDRAKPDQHARAPRSGRSLRTQHGSVEPEDEAVHLRRT